MTSLYKHFTDKKLKHQINKHRKLVNSTTQQVNKKTMVKYKFLIKEWNDRMKKATSSINDLNL